MVVAYLPKRIARHADIQHLKQPSAEPALHLHSVSPRNVDPDLLVIDVVTREGGKPERPVVIEEYCPAQRELLRPLRLSESFAIELTGWRVEAVGGYRIKASRPPPNHQWLNKNVSKTRACHIRRRHISARRHPGDGHCERSAQIGQTLSLESSRYADHIREGVDFKPLDGPNIALWIAESVGGIVEESIARVHAFGRLRTRIKPDRPQDSLAEFPVGHNGRRK